MHFRETKPGTFSGSIEPGEKCLIQMENKKTFVKSEVILNNTTLITEDSGYELVTGKKVWGSNFGPLKFKKIDDFNYFIDRNWI